MGKRNPRLAGGGYYGVTCHGFDRAYGWSWHDGTLKTWTIQNKVPNPLAGLVPPRRPKRKGKCRQTP